MTGKGTARPSPCAMRVDYAGSTGVDRLGWLSLDGLMVSFRCVWLAGGLMSLAAAPPLGWFLRLLALVRLQPGERARFPCGEIPAAVPDGLSVPVVRSGNTGKSRFLGASLPVAVPIPFQDSGSIRSKTGRSTPTSLQSERGGGVRPAARTQCGARPPSIEELHRGGRAMGLSGDRRGHYFSRSGSAVG